MMSLTEFEAFDLMLAALLEIEFGNPAYRDLCPLCGKDRKAGHLGWCRVGKAIALAEKVERRA